MKTQLFFIFFILGIVSSCTPVDDEDMYIYTSGTPKRLKYRLTIGNKYVDDVGTNDGAVVLEHMDETREVAKSQEITVSGVVSFKRQGESAWKSYDLTSDFKTSSSGGFETDFWKTMTLPGQKIHEIKIDVTLRAVKEDRVYKKRLSFSNETAWDIFSGFASSVFNYQVTSRTTFDDDYRFDGEDFMLHRTFVDLDGDLILTETYEVPESDESVSQVMDSARSSGKDLGESAATGGQGSSTVTNN